MTVSSERRFEERKTNERQNPQIVYVRSLLTIVSIAQIIDDDVNIDASVRASFRVDIQR